MGCTSSAGLSPEASAEYVREKRSAWAHYQAFLVLAFREPNARASDVFLTGEATSSTDLLDSLDEVLMQMGEGVSRERGKDSLWDWVWRNATVTSGHQSLEKTPLRPNGRKLMALMDVFARYGFVPRASPNFAGPDGTRKGKNWPMIVLTTDKAELYTKETLVLAPHGEFPQKICACGPASVIDKLKGDKGFVKKVREASHDIRELPNFTTSGEWDVVWRAMVGTGPLPEEDNSFAPSGRVMYAILSEVYKLGWRLVSAPNFGAGNFHWPCFIFRCLRKAPLEAPSLLFGVVKDRYPTKLLLTGRKTKEAGNTILHAVKELQALKRMEQTVPSTKQLQHPQMDSIEDADHDVVLRNIDFSTGRLGVPGGLVWMGGLKTSF